MTAVRVGRDVVIEFAIGGADVKPEDLVWRRLGVANPKRKRKPVKARILKKAVKKIAENKYYLFGE